MKRTLLLIQSLALSALPAHADVALRLPFARVSVQSPDDAQKNIFLVSEARRAYQGIALNGMHLKKVEVAGVAGVTGATLTLKLGENFVDSGSAEGTGQSERLTLNSDGGSGEAWRLGLRGQLTLEEIVLTVSGTADQEAKLQAAIAGKTPAAKTDLATREELAGSQPTQPPVRPTQPPVQPTQPPVQPTQPPVQPTQPSGDLKIGQRVLAVSRSSGIIDYVTIESRQADGTYTVIYRTNQRLTGFGRNQLAVTEGCSDGFCVGQQATSNTAGFEAEVRIVGILPNSQFVVEDNYDQRRSTIRADQLRDRNNRPTPVTPGPTPRPVQPPAPPRPPAPIRTPANPGVFYQGQSVLYVESTQGIFEGTVYGQGGGIVDIRINGDRQLTRVYDLSRIAVREGCIGRLCVGDLVVTRDANRVTHQVRIVGFQTRDLAIVRFVNIGNGRNARAGWPLYSIEGGR